MKFNMETISSIANTLGSLVSSLNPGAGAVIKGVVGAATKLNELVDRIRTDVERKEGETDAEYNARVSVEEQEAWNEVSTDYLSSRAAMLESFKNNPGA